MTTNINPLLLRLFAFFLIAASGIVHAGEKCTPFPADIKCTFVVVVKRAPAYEMPDVQTKILYTHRFLEFGIVDFPGIQASPKNWLPVFIDQEKKGWVKRSDMVPQLAFKPVTGCWPIKTMEGYISEAHSFPGAGFVATFNSRGEGYVVPPRGQKYMEHPKHLKLKVQAFVWGNLILLEYAENPSVKLPIPASERMFLIPGHVDTAGKFYFHHAEIKRQELFDQQGMSGCGPRPKN